VDATETSGEDASFKRAEATRGAREDGAASAARARAEAGDRRRARRGCGALATGRGPRGTGKRGVEGGASAAQGLLIQSDVAKAVP
jgi:hypothetical protein